MISELLIKNGTVWNGEDFIKQDVLIKNGIIFKIRDRIYDDVRNVFDARNMIISSALIDAHTHIKGISPDSIGINAEKISYPFGVTTLIDASAEQGNKSELLKEECDISVFAEATIKDNKADFSFAEKIISKYKEKVIGLKVYFDKTFVNVWDATPLKEICEYSAKNNLKVMVHTTNSPVSLLEIVDSLNKGDIIAHAYHGGKNNASECDYESLKKAKEKGIYIDASLAAHYHIDYRVFGDSLKHNITPDVISSDATKELEFFGGVKYGLLLCMSILETLGLDKTSVFKAVTVNPVQMLNLKDKQRYIRVGDTADIAVLEYEKCDICLTDRFGNDVHLTKQLKCVLTVSDGKIVYRLKNNH